VSGESPGKKDCRRVRRRTTKRKEKRGSGNSKKFLLKSPPRPTESEIKPKLHQPSLTGETTDEKTRDKYTTGRKKKELTARGGTDSGNRGVSKCGGRTQTNTGSARFSQNGRVGVGKREDRRPGKTYRRGKTSRDTSNTKTKNAKRERERPGGPRPYRLITAKLGTKGTINAPGGKGLLPVRPIGGRGPCTRKKKALGCGVVSPKTSAVWGYRTTDLKRHPHRGGNTPYPRDNH